MKTESATSPGIVERIAVRRQPGGPMAEVDGIFVTAGASIDQEPGRSRRRGLTLLSLESWTHTCRGLDAPLPWTFRRANLLISGFDLARTIGRTIDVGSVRVLIHGETKPCDVMDRAHPGLRDALKPDCRGGVHGEILVGGSIRTGDSIHLLVDTGCP